MPNYIIIGLPHELFLKNISNYFKQRKKVCIQA